MLKFQHSWGYFFIRDQKMTKYVLITLGERRGVNLISVRFTDFAYPFESHAYFPKDPLGDLSGKYDSERNLPTVGK